MGLRNLNSQSAKLEAVTHYVEVQWVRGRTFNRSFSLSHLQACRTGRHPHLESAAPCATELHQLQKEQAHVAVKRKTLRDTRDVIFIAHKLKKYQLTDRGDYHSFDECPIIILLLMDHSSLLATLFSLLVYAVTQVMTTLDS